MSTDSISKSEIDDISILGLLYEQSVNNPGEPFVPIPTLFRKFGAFSPERRTELLRKLQVLKENDWITYKVSGTAGKEIGSATIKAEGGAIVREQRENDSQTPPTPYRPPPRTLEEVTKENPECARLIHRDDLIEEIKAYIEQTGRERKECFVVIHAQNAVGKQAFIIRLMENLSIEDPKQSDAGYIPLKVDLQVAANNHINRLNTFTFWLASQMIRQFNYQAEAHGWLRVEEPKPESFNTGDGIRIFYWYLNRIKQAGGEKRLVTIFDDVHSLFDKRSKLMWRILSFLETLVCNSNNGCFVMIGLHPIKSPYHHELNMLLNEGRRFSIGHYNERAPRMVFAAFDNYFADGALEHLSHLCDGQPLLLKASFNGIYNDLKDISDQQGNGLLTSDKVETILMSAAMKSWIDEIMADLEPEERYVVSLLSKYGQLPSLEFPLELLENSLASTHPPCDEKREHYVVKGLYYLRKRGWIEWLPEARFRFKLGILVTWFQRYPGDFAQWTHNAVKEE